MRILLSLFFLGLVLTTCSPIKTLSTPQLKLKIDSANFRYKPSEDLLPPEFNAPSLENEYYCKTHLIFVLRLRNNNAFIYETYYEPYNCARINYRIGNYRIAGDTIYVTYKPLLEGKAEYIYLRPTLSVSFVPPNPPDYLLLRKDRLHDPVGKRSFKYLADKPQFEMQRFK